jgi:hypothetical protein
MNMTKIAAILPLLLAGSAFADSAAFYSITEVVTASDRGSANFGPWPVSISGDASAVASIAVTSNWYSYFRMAPSAMDLAHRFRYENGCTSYLSSATCSAYLNTSNWAATWYSDLSANTAQTYNVVSGSATAETESTGIVTKYGDDASHFAGYVSVDGHKRKAIANTIDLTDGSTFASAYDVIAVGSDYLAVGTESTTTSIAFSQCFSGSNIASYSIYCPGFNTKATFWLLSDPTASKKSSNPYITPSTTYPYTGSAMGIAQVDSNSNYIAVGYSSTAGYSSYAKNLAVYWDLGTGTLGSSPVAVPIFSGDDNPTTNTDNTIDNSWAVAINENGYIVGNRVYRKLVSRNYPTQMFVAKYTSGAVSTPTIPVTTSGVNTEAAALNNNNQVVGWTDERSDVSKPVYGSVPRLQEAFLYNIATGTRYAINDLICSSSTTCSQNGKYYYIEYANGITDDGTIVASARRFDSYSDWSTLSNGTSVVVKLTASTAFDSNYDVPSSYVITNQLPVFDYGASSGGGSFGIFGLLAMAGAAAVGQYRRFVKKAS